MLLPGRPSSSRRTTLLLRNLFRTSRRCSLPRLAGQQFVLFPGIADRSKPYSGYFDLQLQPERRAFARFSSQLAGAIGFFKLVAYY